MTRFAKNQNRFGAHIIWTVIVAANVAISLTVVPLARDPFRIPKELEFRALAILIAAFVIAVTSFRSIVATCTNELVLASAICVWSAISALFSVNRTISFETLFTIVCGALIFIGVSFTANDRDTESLAPIFGAAVLNAIVVILQAAHVWNPFAYGMENLETAFVGNRNDVGVYLIAPAVAAFVVAGVARGIRRISYTCVAIALFCGIVATQTISAVIGYLAAAFTFLALAERSARKPVFVAIAIALLTVAVAFLHPTETTADFVARVESKAAALVSGNVDALTTERVGPLLTAFRMFAKHPLTGVGPGAFHFEYFPEFVEIERRYATLLSPYAARVNFGEVHNDHLQVLAETGIIGYALFAAALIYVGSLSFRGGDSGAASNNRPKIARYLALPLTIGFAVVALAQFPLELAAPRLMFLLFGGVCCAWRPR